MESHPLGWYKILPAATSLKAVFDWRGHCTCTPPLAWLPTPHISASIQRGLRPQSHACPEDNLSSLQTTRCLVTTAWSSACSHLVIPSRLWAEGQKSPQTSEAPLRSLIKGLVEWAREPVSRRGQRLNTVPLIPALWAGNIVSSRIVRCTHCVPWVKR